MSHQHCLSSTNHRAPLVERDFLMKGMMKRVIGTTKPTCPVLLRLALWPCVFLLVNTGQRGVLHPVKSQLTAMMMIVTKQRRMVTMMIGTVVLEGEISESQPECPQAERGLGHPVNPSSNTSLPFCLHSSANQHLHPPRLQSYHSPCLIPLNRALLVQM